MKATFTAILPDKLDVQKFASAIDEALEEQQSANTKHYGEWIGTWSHKPTIEESGVQTSGNDKYVESTIDDEIAAYLDDGTEIRYATMTPDFVPKTSVRQIPSGPGAGGLAYVSKRRPRPGIEARMISDEIASQEAGPFQKRVDDALAKAAANA